MSAPPPPTPGPTLGDLRRHWPWLLAGIGILILLWLAAPVLAPFVIAAAFAYIGDPLVDRLEARRIPRTVGVTLVFLLIIALAAGALLLIVPLLVHQVGNLINALPDWLHWVQDVGLPSVGIHLPPGLQLDASGLKKALEKHWAQAGNIAAAVASGIGQSTPRVIGVLVELFMVPVVAFYLLRDWDRMIAQIDGLVPPRWRAPLRRLARESDEVLAAFIRGQLLVMLALGLIYGIGLWLVGLKVALAIGVFCGLISFVPYLGFIGGFSAASVAMLIQTQQVLPLLWVLLVFSIGQVMESTVLTPNLVGDRVGLHPVLVILVLLVGGQWFGFIGVLLALPVGAVLAVLVRHLREHWLASPLYRGDD